MQPKCMVLSAMMIMENMKHIRGSSLLFLVSVYICMCTTGLVAAEGLSLALASLMLLASFLCRCNEFMLPGTDPSMGRRG